jgi:hypothetical protein
MRKLLTLFSLASWLVLGQPSGPATDADRRAKLPREIRDLIDQSAAAPPELAADILLRLVEAGKIPDKKIKAEVLEQAFVLAGSARFLMRLFGATAEGHNTDSDVGERSMALHNGLDALSLQCRVIRTMLEIDPKRALELFQSMGPPRIPTRSCSEAMVDRADGFYETLALLVNRGFDNAEKREGKHLELAETHIHSMTSPAQLEPAAKMILDLKLDAKRLAPVLSAYSITLHDMSADDRAFSSSTYPEFVEALGRLARDSETKGVSSFGLVDAFRAYYVRHMRGARCEESVDPKGMGFLLQLTAESFNSDLRTIADPEGKQIRPIQADELQPAKVEGRATVYDFWSKPETQKLLADLKQLRFGTPEQRAANNEKGLRQDGRLQFLTVEQRSTLSWQIEAREYLNEVESWNKDHDETEENYFHEVCYIYKPLLELVPAGELWDNVLESYINFLKQSAVEKESPPEWYMEVRGLLELEDAEPAVREKVWAAVKAKGDLVMSMYVDLDRLAGPRTKR